MTTEVPFAAGRTPRPGVAAFDFDGTLVPGDSLGPFLARLLGRRKLAVALASCGAAMAARYCRDGRDGAKAVLLQRALTGVDAVRAGAVGRSFAATLAARIRPTMAARIETHRNDGHRLVLVSASLTLYLEPFAELAGLDDVVATRLEIGPDGRFTGRIAGANVRGREKADRLAALLGEAPVELWAYGDSAGDTELLAMADHPTMVGSRRRGW